MPRRSIEFADADDQDIINFVKKTYYNHPSEAYRDAVRRGIREIKKERGLIGPSQAEASQ